MEKIAHCPTEYDKFSEVTQKIFVLLEALSQPEAGLPLDELTDVSHFPKTTVHRLLYSMSKLGYVERDPNTSRYFLSKRFFDLGPNSLPYKRLTAIAKPLMQELLLTFGESVNLAVLHAGTLIYILVLESQRSHRAAATVGGHPHLHCTAVGKCIAAYLSPGDRRRHLSRYGMPAMTPSTITSFGAFERELAILRIEGLALDNEENTDGTMCVGGPIFSGALTAIAAVSISGPTFHMCEELMAIKKAVRETAITISARLGESVPRRGG
jgi:IclR family transcriptional regulator, KDG regulon repressor